MLLNFDPSSATHKDMALIATHIEEYLMVLEEVMIIPEDLINDKNSFEEAIRTVRRLIKKLKKGDKSVFADYDE